MVQTPKPPWSLITRFATLPLLILAAWSRVWIGSLSLILVLLLVAWALLNPIVFPKNTKIDSW